ncbi:MAG: TolC family protein [Candidatus Macondimonas sp.]
MSTHLARTFGVACWFMALALHAAIPEDPDLPPLTLPQAVAKALARNPDLQGFEFRLRAQDGQALTAALSPPLSLRAAVENLAGTGAARGADGAEASFALSRVIELGGKRQRRLEASGAARGALEIEREAAQLDVLAEVARRLIHVAADQQQQGLVRRTTELAQATLEASEQRFAAARVPEVEVNRARIGLARARLDEEHAEHELRASRRQLAAMWGDTEPDFGRVEVDLYRLPDIGRFDDLLARLERNPDALRYASQARLRDAEIRLAQTRSWADLTVSAGVKRLQETQDQAFVMSVEMPLLGRSRAQGEIVQADALRGQVDATAHAHRVKVQAQLFALHQELQHAVAEVEMLRLDVLPEMEAALQATEYAFRRGRYSYLEWVDAQRERASLNRALIAAAASAHLYQVEIERLTVEPLAPSH